MNLTNEMKAFFNWVRINPMSASTQLLWYTLIQINNECAVKINNVWYWRVEFTVSNLTLTSILNISRKQLDRVRNDLIQSGRLEYKKGKGSQSGTYKLIPFEENITEQEITCGKLVEKVWQSNLIVKNDTQQDTQQDTQYVPQSDTQSDTQMSHKASTLNNYIINNYNNIIYNKLLCGCDGDNTRTHAREDFHNQVSVVANEVCEFATDIFRRYFSRTPTENEIETVFENIHFFNGRRFVVAKNKRELMEYAFSQASNSNKLSMAYVLGVLDNLEERGITTLAECEEERNFG